jgi:glycosidase
MKKTFLLFVFALISWAGFSQIIVTNPAIITKDYTGEIEVIYDAALGTAGLKDYTGTDGVYAHTGVITNASLSDTDWKNAPAWGDNSAKYKLTSLGNNKWKLLITPNMAGYYGLTTGTVVKKLAFVFRNGLKTKEGKDTGGKDIFVTVFDAGLNVIFTNPTVNQSVAAGTNMNISMTSSLTADLALKINNAQVASVTDATTLSHSYTFAAADDYMLIASATAGGVTVYDTAYVNVPTPVVNQTRPAGAKPGINYNSNTSVTLVLHAPNKNNVFAIGDFNDWSQLNAYQLKRDGEFWWITLDNLTPGKLYGFQYLVDGTLRVSDPYTELVLDPWNDLWINQYFLRFPNLKPYPTGKTDGLVATFQTAKTPYNWEVPNFTMPNRENMVIYEMLLRDFTVEKSLEAAIGKLDYLKNLGVTAIELMPIQEFDGNESWGYNPNHFFAPDKAYGSPEMYKKFIDECHKRGMAVIIDVVFNHATGVNPMAALYWNAATSQTAANNPWFNVTAPHPYSVFHDYNHEYQPTREYFRQVLQYWIEEYKVDGYRLDLTKGFTQRQSTEATASNYDQSRIDILTDYYNATKAVKPDVMFILEHFCEYSEELELANRGMYLWRNANNAFSQSAMGFSSSSDFGGLNSTPRRWVGYSESHDEERNFNKAKLFGAGTVLTDSVYRISRVPLNVAFTTLMPGPKMLWQFQELGYDYSINALGGRTSNKPPAWGWLNLPHRKAAYDASSKIITLRKMYPTAFTQGNYQLNVGTGDWENGRRLALTHSDLNLLVLGNFKPDASAVAFPNFPKTGMWYNVLTGAEYYVGSTNNPITLAKGELLIFADRRVNFNTSVEEVKDNNRLQVIYPTKTSGRVYITDSSWQHEAVVYNISGQALSTQRNMTEIDLSAYQPGIYLIRLNSPEGSVTARVVKE